MNFAKTFWAALLAFLAANVVLGLLSMLMFISMLAALGSSSQAVTVPNGSFLKIDLSETIYDAPPATPFGDIDFMTFKVRTNHTLLDVVNAIERASYDDRIRGIYLTGNAGMLASSEELRDALKSFGEEKYIVAYNDVYTQRDYFICSVADYVIANPEGMVEWVGMSQTQIFFKGLLDKLGVEPIVIRHGSFKSAVEPYIQDKMSPENKLQYTTLLGSAWNKYLGDISESRDLDADELALWADELAINFPQDAYELGMVDSLLYQDQVNKLVNWLASGSEEDDMEEYSDSEPAMVSLSTYLAVGKASGYTSKNRIAVVYLNGVIVDSEGRGTGEAVGSVIAEKLSRARKDDKVKAVVFRVNSPGGSALASDVIWREVQLLKAVKPVIVSMGSMAASGGYWVSCGADAILANETTLTGSIGVFGLWYNAQAALKNKLGVTTDVAKTSPHADMGLPFRPADQAERAYVQNRIEGVYKTFVSHVSDGRNLTRDEVDAIGQGRVWLGADALEIGLIDGFGGLKSAIALAADRAGVADDFQINVISDKDTPFSAFLKAFSQTRTLEIAPELKALYDQYTMVEQMMGQSGIQARAVSLPELL